MAGSTAAPASASSDPNKSKKKMHANKNEQLMEAVRRGELTAVRRLVDRGGADVNTVNRSGLSCLQLAIVGEHAKLAEYLVQKGANIFSIDAQGWTALHDAAQMDMRPLVRKLAAKGCKLTATTDLGELPIDVAGSVEMERLLCAEMKARGEEELARDYERYLGLGHMKDSSNHVVLQASHRGTLPICCVARSSPPRLHRRHTAPMGLGSPCSPPLTLQNAGARFRKRAQGTDLKDDTPIEEVRVKTDEKITSLLKLQEAVIDRPRPRPRTPANDSSRLSRMALGSINAPNLYRSASTESDSTVLSKSDIASSVYSQPRGTPVQDYRKQQLHALRSSASISAALGVSFDAVTTDLGEESRHPCPPTPYSPTDSQTISTASSRARGGERDRESEREPPRRRVSFHDPKAMARTKIASGPVSAVDKERAMILGEATVHTLPLDSLSSEVAQKNIEGGRVGSGSEEEEESDGSICSAEAIANLKRKPRKSSIVLKSTEKRNTRKGLDAFGRRRSVTFQPEVLLQEMVLDGDVRAVREILGSGAVSDINKLSPAGLTALHQSAIDGNLACAKALVASGACVNCVDCEQWTPLHASAMSGKIEVVRFLLSNGANPLLKNESGETPYDVAKNGPIRKLLLCAMNGKSPDADEISDGEYSDEEEREYSHAESESEEEGESHCYFGSPKSSHSSVSISPSPDLTEHADNVFLNGTKSPDPSCSDTPPKKLHEQIDSSSSYGSILDPDSESNKDSKFNPSTKPNHHNFDDMNLLDNLSEDQGISTMDGSSDCSHRSRTLSEDEGTLRDVLDSELIPGSLDYRFQDACLYSEVDSLLKLIKHREDIQVDRINKSSGITALHHAVLEENFALVQHLVKDFSSDVQIKDRDGWTALHAASAVGNMRIAQFLLENGAKASVLNNQCEFPVDVAEDEAMEKLLKNAMLGPSVGQLFKGKFA